MAKKNKKSKLLTSNYYKALELLRTGCGTYFKTNEETRMFKLNASVIMLSENRSLGFDFPNRDDLYGFSKLVINHPERHQEMMKKLNDKIELGYGYDDLRDELIKENPYLKGYFQWHAYNATCKEEFLRWLESNKFEIDWGSIESILPTGKRMDEFFGDVQTRLPYEKCLYIGKMSTQKTLFLTTQETNIQDKIDFYTEANAEKVTPDDSGTPDKTILGCLQRWKGLGIETIGTLQISMMEEDTFVLVPLRIEIPIGIPISKMFAIEYNPQCVSTDTYLTINNDVTYFEKHILHNEQEILGNKFYRHVAQVIMMYASVLLDPQFREFAVKEEFHGGLNNDFLRDSKFINLGTPIKMSPSERPKFEHRVLTLNIPKDVQKPNGVGHRTKGTRLHSVRGHMMRTKNKGFVWRKAHWRGKKQFGEIKKEYKIPNEQNYWREQQ